MIVKPPFGSRFHPGSYLDDVYPGMLVSLVTLSQYMAEGSNDWMPPRLETGIPHQVLLDHPGQFRETLKPSLQARPESFFVAICDYFPRTAHHTVGDDWRPGVDTEYLGQYKLRGACLLDEKHLPSNSHIVQIWQKREEP
jgi:hypothetical protein